MSKNPAEIALQDQALATFEDYRQAFAAGPINEEAARVLDGVGHAVSSLNLCEHLSTKQIGLWLWVAWNPEKFRCVNCVLASLPDPQEMSICDSCKTKPAPTVVTSLIPPQVAEYGARSPIIAVYGLCNECLGES